MLEGPFFVNAAERPSLKRHDHPPSRAVRIIPHLPAGVQPLGAMVMLLPAIGGNGRAVPLRLCWRWPSPSPLTPQVQAIIRLHARVHMALFILIAQEVTAGVL